MKTAKLTFNAILAAAMCIIAPVSFHIGAIPVSLATFAVYIIACISKPKNAFACIIIYILLGAVGLPVFSGFIGGIQQIAGITGGYIIGYLPCALIISFTVNKHPKSKVAYPLAMVSGTAVCYLCGTAWYIYQSGADFLQAVSICVLPFLLGDAVKITAASILAYTVKPRLKKFI